MKTLTDRLQEGQKIQQAINNLNQSYQKRNNRLKKKKKKMLLKEYT